MSPSGCDYQVITIIGITCMLLHLQKSTLEYDQEILQSHTADQPMAQLGRVTEY